MKRSLPGGSLPAAKRKGEGSPAAPRRVGGAPWHTKLLESMKDPSLIVKSDEQTVIIRDAYPKARHHYLVLPKEDIPNLRALKGSHLNLLERMLENGRSLAEEVKSKEGSESVTFRLGYHAHPSMVRLHMHVISQDFDSPCLKNKKHWNSFTSGFFLDAEKVIGCLRDRGRVELDAKSVYEAMLKLPLKCHVCQVELRNMPKLKDHLRQHSPK